MRLLPFLKPTKGVQIAGGGFPDSGGGGGSYTLPPATDTTLGGVKIGSGVNVTSDGTISVNGGGSYTLPPATSETLGGIKVGSRLSVESDGTLSAEDQSYTLPTASDSTLGGIKVGSGLTITDGVLSTTGGGGGSAFKLVNVPVLSNVNLQQGVSAYIYGLKNVVATYTSDTVNNILAYTVYTSVSAGGPYDQPILRWDGTDMILVPTTTVSGYTLTLSIFYN